jgi:hypothetical protein
MLRTFTDPNSTAWLVVDRVSILLSYFVVLSIAAFVWGFLRHRRRRRRLAAIAGATARPQAFALAIGGGTIERAVADFLAGAYPHPIPLEEIAFGEVSAQNVHRLLEQVRRAKERFQSDGVTELHLFLKAPVALGAAIGAIFDNWVPVKLYHQQRGVYEAWTTLHQAKRPPLDEDLRQKVQEMIDERLG